MENRHPEEITIVVLSRGRPEIVRTPYAVAGSVVCIPKGQLKAYKAAHPDFEYITHPDKVKGMAAVLQWVYDSMGDIFILDDNIKGMYNLSLDSIQVPPDAAYRIIQQAAATCRTMGKYLFGFSQYAHPRHYNPFQPIRLTGYIPGHAMGLLCGSGLSFNPSIVSAQDFYISGMNAHIHRTIYKDTRFYFHQANRSRIAGGNSDLRSSATDEQDIIELRKLFGDAIRIKKGATGRGFSKVLQVPF